MPDEADSEDPRIRDAIAGDRTALGELIAALEPELRASIRIQPLWSRSLEVDDVLQVSYLEAFLRIASLEKPTAGAFRAWMQRVVQNNLRDAIRALERDCRPDARRRLTHGAGGESARTLLGGLMGATGAAERSAETADEVERLQAAIEALPRSYRQVVRAMDLEERDVGEVAEAMGRSRGAVHLLRARAHERLRELLRIRGNVRAD